MQRKEMHISRKRIVVVFIVVLFLVAACCASVLLFVRPSKDVISLTKYVNEHESELIYLVRKYPNQYKALNNYIGVEAVDTRDEDICFIFSWSFNIPEGGSFLYYADDGILETLGFSFVADTSIDGLGLRGDGYIKCVMLKQNWFFIEYNIPT